MRGKSDVETDEKQLGMMEKERELLPWKEEGEEEKKDAKGGKDTKVAD